MFKYNEKIYLSEQVAKIRKSIYFETGYYIVRRFISSQLALRICDRWMTGQFNYYFDKFYKNIDVNFSTPNYLIHKPSDKDWTFCVNIWNQPPDEELNNIILQAQQIRNIIEGRSLQFGTRNYDDLVLQYRICRTISGGKVVKKHADFIEEYRSDPTGDHSFNPKKCQMTLMLSEYEIDYKNGGFFFQLNDEKEILFGKDIKLQPGDLIIWKYSNLHYIRDITTINHTRGFCRVIFPQYDNFNS